MPNNALGTETAAIVGTIDPDAYTASTQNSDWAAAKDHERFQAIIMAGVLGASATLDAKLQQATDSSGTGAKDIAGKAITQLVKATDDDKQAIINLRGDELDVNNGFDFVRIVMTIGTATSDASALLLGQEPRYAPASDFDLTSVAEIVD